MLPAAQPRLSSLSRRSMLAGMAALACGRSAWAQSPDGQIVLGQTTALSGPLADLGQALSGQASTYSCAGWPSRTLPIAVQYKGMRRPTREYMRMVYFDSILST